MTPAAAPARFTFDLDLGNGRGRSASVSENALAVLVEDARTAGHAEGFAAGEQSASARAAKQLSAAANGLGDKVAALAAALDDSRKADIADAVGLAATVARKLAGALVAREPIAEIEALIAECLASLESAPHLVIRCHPDLADAVREAATARMGTSGFTGRLVVMGEPERALGDAVLEWVDGGILRDQAAITAEIDKRIAAYLAARGIVPASGTDTETEP